MKKYIITIALFCSIISCCLQSMNEERRIKSLTIVATALKNASNKAFGDIRTTVMFDKKESPLSTEGLDAWKTTITQLKGLVAKYNVKKNPLINSYFSQLDNCAQSLINAIKITYNMMFSQKATEAMRIKNRAVVKPIFKKIAAQADAIAAVVGNKEASGYQRAAYDTLFQYALTIERVANSAIEGIDTAREFD